MKIKSVDLLLTFRCPSKCKHCVYKAGPERNGKMKLEDAEEYLQDLAEIHPLQSIGAHGGEPFLYFELLKGIMEKAKTLEIPRTWVITNGYWAKDRSIAKEKLVKLKEAGLTHITFSVDGFHQEYIPFKTVINGIDAAASLGFERICVDSYFLEESNGNNFYDNLTREGLESMAKLDMVEIHRHRVDLEGRAAAELTKYVKLKTEIPEGGCQLPFWIGGNLKNPEGIEIDFEGNVTLCPGICLGNTKNTALTQILENYDVAEHPILSVIANEGPVGLLKMAIAKGFNRQKKYADECNLCYEMRRFLRPYFPSYLSPEACY
ncbi:MAG: radical SAM protein [Candidatus Bathyarchaeota archaeon]|jgi:MoaA/NifB/PqqE/SkfB family radical SAM enzyme